MVFERLPIESQSLFSRFRLCLLVEALASLVAEPLALDHPLVEIRKLELGALVTHIAHHVPNDMAEDVEANQIDGAESRRLRPAHGRTGKRIDLFDREAHLLHDA